MAKYAGIAVGEQELTADTMLELLKKSQVFEVYLLGDRWDIVERFDNYFRLLVTDEMLLALADELRELVEIRRRADR